MSASVAFKMPQPDPHREMQIVALNGLFDEMDALGVLRHAVTEVLKDDVAIVSSFGADSSVLLHMVAQVDRALPVYFLETGKHFPETLKYVETLKAHLRLENVRWLRPDPRDIARFDPRGELWETDPDSCCHIRKTEPLDAEIARFGGWVTGRKRYQTAERGVLPHFELTSDDRIKVNPLAYFSDADVNAYKAANGLPEHPLFAKGYKSIGCAPCTTIVAEGEDPRAGRWRGLNKKECGIHFDFNGAIARPVAAAEKNLFKGGKFIADPFRAWVEGDDPASVRYTHIPLKVFVANRDAVRANPHPIGLMIEADDAIEDVAGELDRFASVAVDFPKFSDGRGYTTARLATERYHYKGELRATGDVLMDQIPLMRRCGINAFVVVHPATRKALETGTLVTVNRYYQPIGPTEVPVGTRPFLRRPAELEEA
ncbi:MAG TPA: phosphoadenylyl-sulfate reductase [Devosia sp.]|nr:phosphoadenylyl-sulfate reductase [Devosia sp.]